MRLRKTAFAMFDALGVRGIWQREDVSAVLAKFAALQDRLRDRVGFEFGGGAQGTVLGEDNLYEDVPISGFISDTVVVAVVPKAERLERDPEGAVKHALIVAARFVGRLMAEAAATKPAWAYRGCLTLGDVAIHPTGNFFVGEGVDVAAQLYEQPEGAFVLLDPSVAALFANGFPPLLGNIPPLTKWAVPMKSGAPVETYVVSPFDVEVEPNEAEIIASNILRTFTNDDERVLLKERHTRAWLDAHVRERRVLFEEGQELVRRWTRGQPG